MTIFNYICYHIIYSINKLYIFYSLRLLEKENCNFNRMTVSLVLIYVQVTFEVGISKMFKVSLLSTQNSKYNFYINYLK